jgi:hypothetical protein
MIFRFLCFCFLLSCFIPYKVTADGADDDVRFTPKLQRAYFDIQKLRILPARALIDQERKIDPENAFIHYLDNYADLHYLLISEDKNAYKALIEKEDQRLAVVGKLQDSSPYKRFFQAEIRLHWAFAKMKFGNEVSGAWDVIKAYRLLDENRKKFPEFLPTLKSLGLLHIMIGSVPENYNWVIRILGLRGNIRLGVQEIETVMRKSPLFRQEAQLVDLLVHAYILQLSEAQQQLIKQLPRDQPDNLLLHFFATTILMKEGNSREASGYLYGAPTGNGYISFPFLDYLKGEVALQQGKYDSAFTFYTSFQKQYKGFNFIKDSNFKLFMCLWLSGKDQQAENYIRRVGQAGSTIVEGDKFAQRMAGDFFENKLLSEQKVLFKARYATDGGYLDEAMDLITPVSEKQFAMTENKAEFNYRKARILQKSLLIDNAIPFYERAIALTQTTAPGTGASSALQLGYIFRDKKQNNKAIAYFKKAISYKKHDYKNSIDNKARAALTELGQ